MKIQDQNFLACGDMPYVRTYQDMMDWLTRSDFMQYVFGKVRKVLVFDYETSSWQGVNYGKKERKLSSKQKGIRSSTRRLLELLEHEELDLLPPQKSYSGISDWENFKHNDIIKVISANQAIMRYFYLMLAKQEVIIKNGQGWLGAKK